MEAKIDNFGRVIIPKPIRRHLGLAPGTRVDIEEHGNSVSITPLEETTVLAKDQGVLVFTGTLEGDIEKAVASDRETRMKKILGLET